MQHQRVERRRERNADQERTWENLFMIPFRSMREKLLICKLTSHVVDLGLLLGEAMSGLGVSGQDDTLAFTLTGKDDSIVHIEGEKETKSWKGEDTYDQRSQRSGDSSFEPWRGQNERESGERRLLQYEPMIEASFRGGECRRD